MPRDTKPITSTLLARESSFVSLLSGWVQQGIENFFATQRILVDLAMRQNASAISFLRDRLADPAYCPVAVLSELAGEGMSNFIEGQKLLLNLAQKEYDIITTGVKERVGGSATAVAVTDLITRSFDTFVGMHQEFLKTANQQTNQWLDAVKAGKNYEFGGLIELARAGMDNFVRSQKKFLDVIVEETSKAATRKSAPSKKRATELLELARQATDAFIDAQKKLVDVAGKQVNAGLKATASTVDMFSPLPFLPLPKFTREGVKTFVDAEKAILDTVMQRRGEAKGTTKAGRRGRRPRGIRIETPHVAHAGA